MDSPLSKLLGPWFPALVPSADIRGTVSGCKSLAVLVRRNVVSDDDGGLGQPGLPAVISDDDGGLGQPDYRV